MVGSKKILLVEDNLIIAHATQLHLTNFGYDVEIATSGEQAIGRTTTDDSINLILMDIDLGPGMDGTQAAEQILNKKNIPIVFLSSHTEKEYVERIRKITRYGYLTKDSHECVLRSNIEMAFELHEKFIHVERSTTQLKQHAAWLRTITEAVIVTDLHLTVTEWNQAAQTIYGWSEAEAIGQPIDELLKTTFLTVTQLEAQHYLAQHGFWKGDVKQQTKDNLTLYIACSVTFLKDEGGNNIGGIAVNRNITDRKQVEHALQKSIETYQLTLSATQEGLWDWDIVNNQAYCSPRWCEIIGYSFDDPALKHTYSTWFDRIHSDDKEKVSTSIKNHLEKEEQYNVDYRHLHSSGEYRWQNTTGKALFDSHKKPYRMVGCIRDIHKAKTIEEELRSSKELFETAFHKAPIGKALNAPDGKWIMVNSALCALLGYTEEQLLATSFQAITHPEDMPENSINYKKTLAGEQDGYRMVKRYFHKQGHIIWVDVSITLVRYPNGTPHYFIAQIQDITERKAIETTLQNLLKEKDMILREVHHRVKNNINTMASLLTLQASAITDVPTANLFKDAIGRLKSMATLYNRLHSTENYLTTSVQAYLNQLVDEVQNLFIGYPVVIEKDFEDFDLSPKQLSSLGIMVNELITNGIKHAFPNGNTGKIKIAIARKNEKASLIYQDNGVGFSIDTKHTESFGLNLIDLLTHELKGKLEVENREGTAITIEFPVNF